MTVATEEVLERLAGSPEQFPAALLLSGHSEAQLERESRRLAARLLCPGNDPEGTCGSCRRVDAGLHPDLMTVEPDGVQIKVDRVREALAFSAGRPYESARRVARILRADLLGIEAENALLKSLEEPGERLRWILTTARPELLLSTIRSRCTPAALPSPSLAARQRAWETRGFAHDDARDLVLFAADDEADPAGKLEQARALRQSIVTALEEGLVAGRLPALVLAAEHLAALDRFEARVLSELLADAALTAGAPPAEAIRHQAVGGRLAALARAVPHGALRDAALLAADPPPDNRKGNRRMHYERVLLELYGAARR
jgi:DNA polymerase III, delta subunit